MDADVLRALEKPDDPIVWHAGSGGGKRTAPSIRERLLASTVRDEETRCLVKQVKERPIITIAGTAICAARVVFYLENGYWPPVVRHTCDNKRCLEPSHLIGGTYKDNTQDALSRNRLYTGRRVDECLRGHPHIPENRYKDGSCRPCAIDRSKERWRNR